ncbi:MAG TPA: hypothetical protein VFA85_12790 [Terriglobales bacterium]|nr:hypothetical protein [Terriglobales bacterium]
MTKKHALKEAQKRWGKTAAIRDTGKTCTCGQKVCDFLHARYAVGRIMCGLFFEVHGDGKSWEEAFEAADKKKAADEERYKNIIAERKKR